MKNDQGFVNFTTLRPDETNNNILVCDEHPCSKGLSVWHFDLQHFKVHILCR